ncbi:MAG: hypothetical protein LH650_04960 [Chloroflexi bacterium]|nr:hypothetical protein [Chloroflexota bacterium]
MSRDSGDTWGPGPFPAPEALSHPVDDDELVDQDSARLAVKKQATSVLAAAGSAVTVPARVGELLLQAGLVQAGSG